MTGIFGRTTRQASGFTPTGVGTDSPALNWLRDIQDFANAASSPDLRVPLGGCHRRGGPTQTRPGAGSRLGAAAPRSSTPATTTQRSRRSKASQFPMSDPTSIGSKAS